MTSPIPDDGATIYNADGNTLGTIHFSTRSRRWYTRSNRVLSPSRFRDAQEAADSLRAGVTV